MEYRVLYFFVLPTFLVLQSALVGCGNRTSAVFPSSAPRGGQVLPTAQAGSITTQNPAVGSIASVAASGALAQ